MEAVSSPDATRRIRLVLTAGLAIAAMMVVAILVQPQPATAPPGQARSIAPGVALSSPSTPSSPSSTPTPSRPPMTIEVNPPGPSTPQLATTKNGRPVVLSCFDLGFRGGVASNLPPATWVGAAPHPPKAVRNGLIVGVHGSHVMTLNPRSGTLTWIAEFADGIGGGAQWSPTGTALLITSGSGYTLGSCSSVDVLSDGHLVRVAAGRGGRDVHWSPDGSSLATLGQTNVTYRFDGTTGSALPACGEDCWYDSFLWSPDGRHVVARRLYNDEHADIALITVKTGEVRVLPGSKGLGLDRWLDARTVLLDARSRDGRARWVAYRLDGKRVPARRAIDASTVARLVLEPSPDLRSAAGAQCIWCPFIVLHGGVPRIVWRGHPPMDQAWSPDSRWVAFTVRGNKAQRGTWVVRADGTHRHRISSRILEGMDWGAAPR